jgi:alkylhydroperoxidase/carboxymuconolactone decarboxylase family protein YurZ
MSLKGRSRQRCDKRLSFRKPVESYETVSSRSRKIYAEIMRRSGALPEIYLVRALADNPRWLRLLHKTVFQWPRDCALDEKTKELVGLAKSIGHLWESGVLTNIEGAINAGATSEEITETILIASMVIGLADIDHALRATHFRIIGNGRSQATSDGSVQRVYDDASAVFGSVPDLYRSEILVQNPDWLQAVHESAKIRYTDGVLGKKTKALICLGASAAKRWDKGIEDHLKLALKLGARPREIADVLCSTYKTAVSIGIQTGFSVPCSIPEMSGFRLLKDYYAKPHSPRRLRGKHKR